MKIALVTGASGGMGREIARLLAKNKDVDELWLVARREDRLRDLAAELMIRVKTKIFVLDLTDPHAAMIIKRALRSARARISWLVCAAGFGQIGCFECIPYYEQMAMIDLNCRALTAITHVALPYMRKKGHIVLFSSAAAFLPQPEFAVYAATKSYVLSFARALARELKPKQIAVTAVCPGPVQTEFFDVAEKTGKAKPYKKLFMADCYKTSKGIVAAAEKGKPVYVPTLSMKSFRVFSKLPHSLILSFLGGE